METNLKSEIVNQKKQFIFDVEPTSNYVFPYENIRFYVYIKNISGVSIDKFTLRIEKSDQVILEMREIELPQEITIKNNEVKLYTIDGYCEDIGEYYIHFIGYGEGTAIAHDLVKIKCNRTYNSEKLIHKIHIYDFNPYESKFSLEADNFSNEVTQTFKRQKLPYKAGEQPFPVQANKGERNLFFENKDSQYFIDQYNEVSQTRQSNEHVYQYISRENFTEDSLESYTGENLYEIISKINQNSEYFKATFLRSGTNHLLNDFTQYKPNGFIYRMGLLGSEIYHALGVLPSFSYMSDRLFRWAPSPTGQHIFYAGDETSVDTLLNLYPEQKAMKWGENVWAGKGWNVYKIATKEYIETDEFKDKLENNLISYRRKIDVTEEKKDAEMLVEQMEYFDNIARNQEGSDLVKFQYEIQQSLYDSGVFFIHIPVNKIPSNFYLLNVDDLYKIVNRAKPYGVKPIIDYVIEKDFDCSVTQKVTPNYKKRFDINSEIIGPTYRVSENNLIQKTIECGNKQVSYISNEPTRVISFEGDFNLFSDFSGKNLISLHKTINSPIQQNLKGYITSPDQLLTRLEDIEELLYKNNYNNISFKINKASYSPLTSQIIITEDERIAIEDSNGKRTIVGSIELSNPISEEFTSGDETAVLSIVDTYNRQHKFSIKYDKEERLCLFKYIYENTRGESYIRKVGYQNVKSIIAYLLPFENKQILLLMVTDENKDAHYFYHTIIKGVQDIKTFKNGEEFQYPLRTRIESGYDKISLETPFCYYVETYKPTLVAQGTNWENLYRFNNKDNSYAYIQNTNREPLTPDDIILFYDNIQLQETSIIKKLRLKIKGDSFPQNNIYIDYSKNTNYRTENSGGNLLQLRPAKIEVYSEDKESNIFYKSKLEIAEKKEQATYIRELNKLIDENIIFNEDIDIETSDYLLEPNDFISISKPFWCEISEFTNNQYNLNNIENISLVIEGYNSGEEINLKAQTSYDVNNSSPVLQKIPKGYFYKKIPLYYPNNFLLDLLRVRFRFVDLNNEVKIFNTSIECNFKDKENEQITYSFIEAKKINNKITIDIEKDDIYPVDLNNGLGVKLSFEDLRPGAFYHLNSIEAEIIYQDTDVDLMINKNKYHYESNGSSQTTIQGLTEDAYLSGLFYNDAPSVSQIKSNVGYDNNGIELRDAIFQSFESRDDNITSIEIYPQGFVGNPDECLKIGLYTNYENTPDKLIKEVYANGWTKGVPELKGLNSIKYNINVDNLEINKTYWIKIEVLNKREESYYVLKSINETLPRHKLLLRENNNYINTFSNLTFNIYSRNLSESFGSIPTVQEFFDNPYILIGLHKGQGTIKGLQIHKYDSEFKEDEHMKEYFDGNIEKNICIVAENNGKKYKADFNKREWNETDDDCEDEMI